MGRCKDRLGEEISPDETDAMCKGIVTFYHIICSQSKQTKTKKSL